MKGKSGFGIKTQDLTVRTEWKTSDIWLRKEFEISDKNLPKNPILHIFYDDMAEVYINGHRIDNNEFNPFQTSYAAYDIDTKLFKSGNNIIAIHCNNKIGGQGIDAGIYDIKYGE